MARLAAGALGSDGVAENFLIGDGVGALEALTIVSNAFWGTLPDSRF
jgi:hypothetical protein